jgi:hypothetical protein
VPGVLGEVKIMAASGAVLAGVAPAVPYRPGWVNRLIAWVKWVPGPSWLVYVLAGVVMLALGIGESRLEGVVTPDNVLGLHLALTVIPVYVVALIHYLDHIAAGALQAFRPALTVDDAAYERLRYELITMPARWTLLANSVGLVVGFMMAVFLLGARTFAALKITGPAGVSTALYVALIMAMWAMYGVFGYHTLRQLTLVSRIYSTATHVDLFRLSPFYAFSGLSARTALGWVLVPYLLILVTPAAADSPNLILGLTVLTCLGLAIFAWPLLGIHNVLTAEKTRLLDENGRQIEAVASETHRKVGAGDMSNMADLKYTMDTLIAEQGVIAKASTWPWQSGTVGIFVSALLLPVIVWAVQRILERLGF